MFEPKIAIVGRPNVGKSVLFNRLAKKRVAIVHEEEGVTRDRIYASCSFFSKNFIAIDTGGINPESKKDMEKEIKNQAEIAINEADSIIMVVDGMVGPTHLDKKVAKILLKTKKTVLLAINKIDEEEKEHLVHQFYELGIEKMFPISAIHGSNIEDLIESSLQTVEKKEQKKILPKNSILKIAIVGKTNVGKSTLLNSLLKEKRSAATNIPGTTRDSIDATMQVKEKKYLFIDTAGIRKKQGEKNAVDKFARIRTKKAIKRADICLFIIDAKQGISSLDKKILQMIEEEKKGCVLLINKWDLVKKCRMEHCLQGLEKETFFLQHVPKLCLSAKTKRNMEKIFPLVEEVREALALRINTSQLNKFIEKSLVQYHPPRIQGKRLRIYYLTQIGEFPPSFVLFVNHPKLLFEGYKRYLMNQLRKTFAFAGVPLIFYVKGKKTEKNPFLF